MPDYFPSEFEPMDKVHNIPVMTGEHPQELRAVYALLALRQPGDRASAPRPGLSFDGRSIITM